MTQTYGSAFARVYNSMWGGFARGAAPAIREFYEDTAVGRENRRLLDLACGTGQLAQHFLDQGYTVVGLDLSEAMLAIAGQNCAPFVAGGQARFVQADAADFNLGERFGLIASTFDALNHLPDMAALERCLAAAQTHLVDGGWLVFDLNTRRGLHRWDGTEVAEQEDVLVIMRGVFDGLGDRATIRVTGFVRGEDGRYERFDQDAYNTVFQMTAVRDALYEAGFEAVRMAALSDLNEPLPDPEALGRVFFLARKGK